MPHPHHAWPEGENIVPHKAVITRTSPAAAHAATEPAILTG